MILKKIFLTLCLGLMLFNACNLDNQNLPRLGGEDIVTSKLTYKVGNFTFYETEIRSNENVLVMNHIYDFMIPNEDLRLLLGEYAPEYYIPSLIYEVEWYDGETLVTEGYKIKKDTVLTAKAVAGYLAVDGVNGKLIGYIHFSTKNELRLPTLAYYTMEISLETIPLTLYHYTL